jgi:hypothetical protein
MFLLRSNSQTKMAPDTRIAPHRLKSREILQAMGAQDQSRGLNGRNVHSVEPRLASQMIGLTGTGEALDMRHIRLLKRQYGGLIQFEIESGHGVVVSLQFGRLRGGIRLHARANRCAERRYRGIRMTA